jgi:hypothetical protein
MPRNQIADLFHRGVHMPCWIAFLFSFHPCLVAGAETLSNIFPLSLWEDSDIIALMESGVGYRNFAQFPL